MSSKLMILTVLGFFSGVNTYAGINQDFQCEEPPLVERSALSSEDLKSNEIQESKLDRLDELLNQGLKIIFTSNHVEEELDKIAGHEAKFEFSCVITTNRTGIYGDSRLNLKSLIEAIAEAEKDFRMNKILVPLGYANDWSQEKFKEEKELIENDFKIYPLPRLTSLDPSIFCKIERLITKTKVHYQKITHVSIKKEEEMVVIRNYDSTETLAKGLTFSEAIMNFIATRTHI